MFADQAGMRAGGFVLHLWCFAPRHPSTPQYSDGKSVNGHRVQVHRLLYKGYRVSCQKWLHIQMLRVVRGRAVRTGVDRRVQVAVEWATVRAEAQRAKAAADKPRQKAAGQLIAALKREIAALGAH